MPALSVRGQVVHGVVNRPADEKHRVDEDGVAGRLVALERLNDVL